MKSCRFCIFLVIYALMVLILLDCDNIGSSAQANNKKSKNSKSEGVSGKKKPAPPEKCPKDKMHSEEFQMKMALCRPNISIICTAKPNSACFSKGSKLKATAFVHRRNGQCLIESNVTEYKTLRFYVEAKRVLNPNADGSRSVASQYSHQRGKCLLKYVCNQRFLRTITMECGSVFADERGTLTNFTRQRSFWVAPPKFTDFVHFFADMSVSSDKRVLNISSAKLYAPGMEKVEQSQSTTALPIATKQDDKPTTEKPEKAQTAAKPETTVTTTTKKPDKPESESESEDDDD